MQGVEMYRQGERNDDSDRDDEERSWSHHVKRSGARLNGA
jgi:hypothetical protein